MSDTTIKKVEAASSPKGEMGQRYLVAVKRLSMRGLMSPEENSRDLRRENTRP
jgi:hypothetical protein